MIQIYFAECPLPFLYIPPLGFNVIPNLLCLPYASFIRYRMPPRRQAGGRQGGGEEGWAGWVGWADGVRLTAEGKGNWIQI